jgi:Fur family transcriptional regulator, peroxide stress response regulator
MNYIVERLKSSSIKPSYARIKIMEYLLKHPVHPTVEEIYQNLVKEIPTLSKTTVYNTLDLFIRHGLARMITIEENETRYDAETGHHGHFKCETCGGIYDFLVEEDGWHTRGIKDFVVTEKHVYFKGICKKCLQAE